MGFGDLFKKKKAPEVQLTEAETAYITDCHDFYEHIMSLPGNKGRTTIVPALGANGWEQLKNKMKLFGGGLTTAELEYIKRLIAFVTQQYGYRMDDLAPQPGQGFSDMSKMLEYNKLKMLREKGQQLYDKIYAATK